MPRRFIRSRVKSRVSGGSQSLWPPVRNVLRTHHRRLAGIATQSELQGQGHVLVEHVLPALSKPVTIRKQTKPQRSLRHPATPVAAWFSLEHVIAKSQSLSLRRRRGWGSI